MDEKLIINKLLKLAEKQQKILAKLAQAVQEDVEGNKAALKTIWENVAGQSGINPVTPVESVEYAPGGVTPGQPNIETGSTYTVTGAIPEDKRMAFKMAFEQEVAAQKPELADRVGMIFKDPQ